MSRTVSIILTVLLCSSAAFLSSASKAEEKAGVMIDEMMKKQGLADAASAAITAESALPHKSDDETAAKPAMDDAVKMALANLPGGHKTESAIKGSNASTGTETKKAETEDQQPVFSTPTTTTKTKLASNNNNLWWRMLGSLAIVFTLFGGGIFAMKKWPGAKKLTARSRMIEVLSQHHLGPKRSLAIVRVAGEACLIGITDNNISILKTLALMDEDVPTETRTEPRSRDGGLGAKFQKTLAAKFTKSATAESQSQRANDGQALRTSAATGSDKAATYGRSGKTASSSGEKVSEEEFTMQGLREIVGERLKTMREL